MGIALRVRLERAWQKNADELIAFATGRMPGFVTGNSNAALASGPPVFCFHDVEPQRFEEQLRYLRDNGYDTLDAAGLEARLLRRGEGQADAPRAVALTFDDGTWSFWTWAFPLLRRYGARAILFVIPGIVPDDPTTHPNLEDLAAGRVGEAALAVRGQRQPLCTWRELEIMHRSGLVDVQSHSMTHSRVPVSERIVDFFHPGYPIEAYGNVNLPVPVEDDPRRPLRALAMGAPIFESCSRMAGSPRFKESQAGVAALARHVSERGGERFFARPGWRRELAALARRVEGGWGRAYESRGEMEEALLWELARSRTQIEERLAGKRVSHFCYPWFQGSPQSDALAARAGYSAVHYGLLPPSSGAEAERGGVPLRIPRLSEEYLQRLPGAGRVSLGGIWARRLRGSLGRRRALP